MELKDYKPGDESEILALFEIVFKQKLKLDNWYWRFRDNPAGQYMIKLMWDKDRLIGHYAVSPTNMTVENQQILTAHSLTTMTHPDYGGKGIFKTLSKAMYHDLENNHNCKAIWGFPNNNSHYGFIKRLEWKNLVVLHTLGLDFNQLNPKDIQFKVREICKFDDNHQAFISSKIRNFAIVNIKNNTSYLNWRFIKKPNSNYFCFEFDHDSSKAILIVKPYLLKNIKTHQLNILACYMDDFEHLHDYILHITKVLKLKFSSITLWQNIFNPDHLEFERQGFVPVLPQTYLASRVHPSMPTSFSDFRNWDISMSYSDVF